MSDRGPEVADRGWEVSAKLSEAGRCLTGWQMLVDVRLWLGGEKAVNTCNIPGCISNY